MLITISGTPGAGKGTVAKLLARKYKVKHYSIGDIRRQVAIDRGMTLEEFNHYGETHRWTDLEPDAWAAKQAKKNPRGIYDGRMMWLMIPQSVKVFLECSLKVGAERIAGHKHAKRKHEADITSPQKALLALRRRITSDTRRYRMLYRVNIFDPRHYDIVVNTTKLTPRQVLAEIIRKMGQQKEKTHSFRKLGTKTK